MIALGKISIHPHIQGLVSMLQPPTVILYRLGNEQIGSVCIPDMEEYNAASKIFEVYTQRCNLSQGSLVIPRYSALPYYKELENDLDCLRCTLINTYAQHRYVADIANYYPDIKDITPKTWIDNWADIPEGSYVVKGRTNSRKNRWNTMMFAKDRKAVGQVVGRLLEDTYIAEQRLAVREYVPLETFDIGINGCPIANEWRFFILDGIVLIGGFYWASEPDYCPSETPPIEASILAAKVAQRLKDKIRFFVVDVAKTAKGDWIVVELNDGSMSGIAMIDPIAFYKELRKRFD